MKIRAERVRHVVEDRLGRSSDRAVKARFAA